MSEQVKYHYNARTGKTGICHAETIESCRVAPGKPHFASEREAHRDFELQQSGSFSHPLKSDSNGVSKLWDDDVDFRAEKIGTVVEFSDGTRFMKTALWDWETSADGGFVVDTMKMKDYANDHGIAPGVRIVHEEAAERRVEAPEITQDYVESEKDRIKLSTVQHASYEESMQARKYLLLLNHRDPDQLKAAQGNVKDQELVEDLIGFNETEERINEHRARLGRTRELMESSKSEAQREGYAREAARQEELIESLKSELKQRDESLKAHVKHYTGRIAIHRNALAKLERVAEKGSRAQIPGSAKRLAKLSGLMRRPSIAPLVSAVESHDPEILVKAARAYGREHYVVKMQEHARINAEVAEQAKQLTELRKQSNRRELAETEREELRKELERREDGYRELQRRLSDSRAHVKLLEADLHERKAQEEEIHREFFALAKLTGALEEWLNEEPHEKLRGSSFSYTL